MGNAQHHPVVSTRDAGVLLASLKQSNLRIEDALDTGLVQRVKVSGRWLYFADESSLDLVKTTVELDVDALIASWFLAPMPWLPGIIAKRWSVHPPVRRDVVEPLLRDIVHSRRYGTLGVLSQTYQPYLALYVSDLEPAIREQLSAMRQRLEDDGRVRPADLPSPPGVLANQGWRSWVLSHGEFLGLGVLDQSVLVAWHHI